MPEGPSILILHEILLPYKKKKIVSASGYADIDFERLNGKTITDLRTWGKHTLICFKDFTVLIHLMMFGSYTINTEKKYNPKLSLQFKDDKVNFYLCQVKILEEPLDDLYDWSADIMSQHWSVAKARKKLKEHPAMLISDALLDQNLFAGSGNIIKNEVLFNIKVHPESLVGKLPAAKVTALLTEVTKYAFNFLKWRKAGTLSKHWNVYEQKICTANGQPVHKKAIGKNKRQSYFCAAQKLYK